MSNIAESLSIFLFFSPVPADVLRTTAPLFKPASLRLGDALWKQGSAVDGVVLVVSGELAVLVDGTEVGQVVSGELAGEASVFIAGSTRTATLVARKPTEVL